MKSLKEMVKNNNLARFVNFEKDHLYYATECGFVFPVPVSDVGDGVFHATEKAMLLMRYIRKQIDKPVIESKESGAGNIEFVRFAKNQLIYKKDSFEFPVNLSEAVPNTLKANEDESVLKSFIDNYAEIVNKEKSRNI